MKKYKLLKDLLCFKKGEVHTMDIISISFSPKEAASMCPDSFKDWFEEIKEPSDEEIVAEWCNSKSKTETFNPWPWDKQDKYYKAQMIAIAKAIISKGFKAEWVKECEHEWIHCGSGTQEGSQFWDYCKKCGARE